MNFKIIIKGKETYLTVIPTAKLSAQEQAEEIFLKVKQVVSEYKITILQERIFLLKESINEVKNIYNQVFKNNIFVQEPAYLVVPECSTGSVSGIVLYGIIDPELLVEEIHFNNQKAGLIALVDDQKILLLTAIINSTEKSEGLQTKEIFNFIRKIFTEKGFNIHCIARTWCWLTNILDWYGIFNKVRNEFFLETGIISADNSHKLPASTGIGIGPVSPIHLAIDLIAFPGTNNNITYFEKGGKQDSAFSYGSAFSRATKVKTPGGQTVFISGTASIGLDGQTIFLNDAEKQIEATINNVIAILKETGCTENDIVQGMAYCKTAEIEAVYLKAAKKRNWGLITLITDICRDNLLFEIEITAISEQ